MKHHNVSLDIRILSTASVVSQLNLYIYVVLSLHFAAHLIKSPLQTSGSVYSVFHLSFCHYEITIMQ